MVSVLSVSEKLVLSVLSLDSMGRNDVFCKLGVLLLS